MRVTIAINNYNYGRFVDQAIDSALAQDWDDVEVIVVDDGSTDDSRSVIDRYKDRVTAVYQPNSGQAAAMLAGLNEASGEMVVFLDADDLIESSTARKIAATYIDEPETTRVQWPMRVIDASGEPTGAIVPDPAMMPNGDLRDHVVRFRTHVWPAQSGNAYATSALRELFPLPDEFRLGGDLWLAEATALLGPVRSLPEAGGSYRVHGENHYAGASMDPGRLHQKIRWTTASHRHLHALGSRLGIDVPADERTALDVAFASVRLASLRLDPAAHPVGGDRRMALAASALRAAIAHPHHTRLHKAKRCAWITGVGLGNEQIARRLIRRFYFNGR